MTPEIQKLLTDAIFRATLISGVLAASISSFVLILNGWRERSAANKRHSQELASEERRHAESLASEQRKLEATMESERRRQAQSLAVQLALEKWKHNYAIAVRERDEEIAEDAAQGMRKCSYDINFETLEVTVRRMVTLTETIAGKKSE